jgi:hypothetical protein
MVARRIGFTDKTKEFGDALAMLYVLAIAVVPLFFPHVTLLLLAPMFLGMGETIGHTTIIRVFHLGRPTHQAWQRPYLWWGCSESVDG